MASLGILLPLFGLILVGFAAGRAGLLPKPAVSGLVAVASSIEIPALLFRGLASGGAGGAGAMAGLAYLAGTAATLATAYGIARRGFGLARPEACVFGLGCVYSNSSFLGVPIAQALYGQAGLAVLAQVVAIHSLVLLPALTAAVAASTAGRPGGAGRAGADPRAVARAAMNPMVLAMAAGLAWSLLGLPLPHALDGFLAMLGAAAAPTALIAVGATAAGLPVPDRVAEPGAGAVVKLAVHPALVFACCHALGLPPLATTVATVTAALPPGVNVYLLAARFGCYADASAQALAVSTAASLASVAALLAVLA